MSEPFTQLADAIDDDRFVDVDLALRRGRHVDRDDADWYGYLLDARQVLEPFYQRYACELVHRTDGYFFLLPIGEKVPKRQLGLPEMIVGQGAALLYLDPSTIESGGTVSKEDILSHLAAVMGTDALVSAFNPKRKRLDERVAQEAVRQRVAEGLRKLSALGFVELLEDNHLRLRSALMRFADPVRAAGSPREALERLVARGEISFVDQATDTPEPQSPEEPSSDSETEDSESEDSESDTESQDTGSESDDSESDSAPGSESDDSESEDSQSGDENFELPPESER